MEGQAPDIEELHNNLRQQLALYKRLLDVLREERECLVAARVKEIRDCTYTKEALLDEIQREELRRIAWAKLAVPVLGVPLKDLTMELVANRLAPPDKIEPLLSLRTALTHLVTKAKEMNLDNKRLAEAFLADAQTMKQNVLGLSSEKPQVYGPKGQMGGGRDHSARFLNTDV